ncbi:MAG TPA: AgmX/PglI C-terminal domain-containing protein [Steroidobacteraceae bacterium]|nr:AgmX/PglI C-terminal domain-containing protein [Steroidobacteraceae bacterium]
MATSTTMMIAPYYRLFELPWSPTAEVEERFRKYLKYVLIVFLLFGLVIPFLPKVDSSKLAPAAVPERFAKLIIEKKLQPPPPKPEPVVETPKSDVKPKPEPPKEDAQKKASKALKVFDELAALRDQSLIDKAQQNKLNNNVGEQTRSERSLITSKVGVGSGGINTANMSRSFGGGTGDLVGRDTTKVNSNLGSADGRAQVTRTSGSGKGARSREEVELIFDRNKGAIYALYTRALRDNPDLKGKVVFELTISATGEILNCTIVSSELHDAELERKLIARVKLFKFDARDVEPITLTKPIEFFPAG